MKFRRSYFFIKTVLLLALQMPTLAWGFSLEQEIDLLNRDYGQAMNYPIVVVNKNKAAAFITSSGASTEAQKIAALQKYTDRYHNVSMENNEAANILPYILQFKDSALALPFYQGQNTKVCYVLPSFSQNDHEAEINRILGNNSQDKIYQGFDISKAMTWMKLEELHLFSLYHELSHCFDNVYIKRANQNGGDAHSIHEAEVFAETNALFMLAQKKSLRNLAFKRALLRGTYTKYMGPYLAQQPPSMAGDAYNKGGSIYFLSPALLKAQQQLESSANQVLKLSLSETLQLSYAVARFSALPSRSFHALHSYFVNGRVAALKQYQEMSQQHPDLFMQAYADLLNYDAFLKSLNNY